MGRYFSYVLLAVVCVLLCGSTLVSAVTRYAYMGPYDICDPVLSYHNIPVLSYGHIRSPNYPQRAVLSHNCEVTVQVERESWLGIYTGSFSILPAGDCVSSNELQLSSSMPGPVKHYCGVHKGLLYRKYMPSAGSFIHLRFKSTADESGEGSLFELNYIIAKAIFNGGNNSRKIEASTIGHIVSHNEFTDKPGPGYRTNTYSSLTLTGLQPDTVIDLDFLYFDVYQYDDISLPCADYLEISGATRPSDQKLPRLCGWKHANDSIIKTIVTVGDEITFTFNTKDRNDDNKGFLIRYSLLPVIGETTTEYYTPYTTDTNVDKESINNFANRTGLKTRLSSVKLPGKTSTSTSTSIKPKTPRAPEVKKSNATASLAPASKKVLLTTTSKHRSYVTELSIGIGSLLAVLVIVLIAVVVVLRRTRTQNLDGCYSEHIFSVGRISPIYNSTASSGIYANDENIYYNDVDVFERHCNVQSSVGNEENFYHVVERPTCSFDQISVASSDHAEYEICGNIQRTNPLAEGVSMAGLPDTTAEISLHRHDMIDNVLYGT